MKRTYTIYNKDVKGTIEIDWTPEAEKYIIEVPNVIPKQEFQFTRKDYPFMFVDEEISIDARKLESNDCDVVTVTGLNLPFVQLKNKLLRQDYESWQWKWNHEPVDFMLNKNLKIVKGAW